MKKIAVLLAVLMAMGAVPGWCLSQTVDNFLDNRSKSDLRPVEDSAKILSSVNKGIDKSLDAVPGLKERDKVLDPVRKVRKETVGAAKTIVNKTWDILTFKSMRK